MVKKIQLYSRFTGKGPSIAERVTRSISNLFKKPVFEKGNADWLSELPSVVMKNNNTFHHSIKMTAFNASRKSNEKLVYSNLQDRRVKQKPKCKLGDLVKTSNIRFFFNKGDSTNYSYKAYTMTEVLHDTISSYRIH